MCFVDDSRGGLDPSILAEKTDGRPSLWPMFAGFVILCLLVFICIACAAHRVPEHGDIWGLTNNECVPLAWVPISAFALASARTPRRWWLYYGLTCCIILLPALHDYVFYGNGRRPWFLNLDWARDGGILMVYLAFSPFLAATARRLLLAGPNHPASAHQEKPSP